LIRAGRPRFVFSSLAATVLVLACSVDDGPGRIAADAPDRAAFEAPGKLLVARCGSLDCHGSTYRNYRLLGYGGARLDPSDRPDTPATTAAELTIDYDATVGIEPERTRAIAEGREPVMNATLVRKGRGLEKHEGGTRLSAGSPIDSCVLGWLTRAPNADACTAALRELDVP
jgi:hypothetical protein